MSLFQIDRLIKRPVMRICMMGPRAVGKTTILTSIFSDTQDNMAGTGLFFRYKTDSDSSKLVSYRSSLESCIEKKNPSMLPATPGITDFSFETGYNGRAKADIVIKDFPGEYLTDPARQEDIQSFLLESNVILVAIDTPYLMEEGGRYNREKNKPEVVLNYLMRNAEVVANKLVLFIPLKCERYFHGGKMEEIAEAVRKSYIQYKDVNGVTLLDFFRNNNVASLIVPILTLGGIEFDYMIDAPIQSEVTKVPLYRMYAEKPEYRPLFCVQPMYHLMTYTAAYTEWMLNKSTGVQALLYKLIASLFNTDEAFKKAVGMRRQNLLTDTLGFKVITTNSIFKV